jgi:cytochrome c biogenesis protein CcdA/thiol-disulfide isomerase/thioredoxin
VLLLLTFSFLAGFVTILTPCIWPLLPIVLASSITGKSHHRPLGVTLGIMLSFAIFTLLISGLVRLLNFDPNALRLVSVVVIGILGIVLILPGISSILEGLISRLVGLFGITRQQSGNGFVPGFVTGIALGIVWTPCAGPILAAIVALAATGKISLDAVLVIFAYVLGIGVPLFIFAYAGQQLFTKAKFISAYTGRIQQVFGVIMILTALAIYTNYDVYIETQLLNAFPGLGSTLNTFESNSTVTKQLNLLKGGSQSTPQSVLNSSDLFNTNSPAPGFSGGTKWLNTTKPLSLADLKGKVILVDFWTYTCINCIRTLPHVTAWYEKYKNFGFVVIGVHTPEFQFEHDTGNVQNAIKMFNIHYPVVQDNNYAIWNAYNNQYWPAEYLIDANGNIRRENFGEGDYAQTEQAIQTLLQQSGKSVPKSLLTILDQTPQGQLSPETYLNSDKMQYYYPDGNTGNISSNFVLSNNLPVNSFSLGGNWTIDVSSATAGDKAELNYNFYADKVYLVLNPGPAKIAKAKIYLDGALINRQFAGSDVTNGEMIINSDRLYNLIDLRGTPGTHILNIQFETPGIQAFAFTFG